MKDEVSMKDVSDLNISGLKRIRSLSPGDGIVGSNNDGIFVEVNLDTPEKELKTQKVPLKNSSRISALDKQRSLDRLAKSQIKKRRDFTADELKKLDEEALAKNTNKYNTIEYWKIFEAVKESSKLIESEIEKVMNTIKEVYGDDWNKVIFEINDSEIMVETSNGILISQLEDIANTEVTDVATDHRIITEIIDDMLKMEKIKSLGNICNLINMDINRIIRSKINDSIFLRNVNRIDLEQCIKEVVSEDFTTQEKIIEKTENKVPCKQVKVRPIKKIVVVEEEAKIGDLEVKSENKVE